jgi:hypothetical protein
MRWAPLVVVALAGCAVPSSDGVRADTWLPGEQPAGGVVDAFDAAGAAYDVPVDLLIAIARTETGLQDVTGAEEFPGQSAAYGVMALRGDHLAEGARLAGLEVERVQVDRAANVLAAAALLDAWASEAGLDRRDLGAWAPLVARYSGIGLEEAAAAYVHDEVYRHLQLGIELEGVVIGGYKVQPQLDRPPARSYVVGAERPYATWRPSPNYNSRGSTLPGMVVIHTCEGSYSSCWGWLANPASGVSAHYVVNDSGSEISQQVHEEDRAWHVGATYDCALNDSTDCWRTGTSVNTFTIGIEHAGFAAQSSWSDGLLDASAQLVCDITEDHAIPRDRFHIVAHGQLQPYNRTDPGANWPWTDYIDRVRTACGDPGAGQPGGGTPSGRQVVIDSNNALNGVDTEIQVSANWISSTNVYGYYNTGYWAAPTAPVSDAARFRFYETQARCYQVQGWWTAASDRAPSAPFIAKDATGAEVGRTYVDQRYSGARWVDLGLWPFTAGWNEVALSRWTTSGAYVIADALRLVETTGCPGFAPPFELIVDTNAANNGPDADVEFRGPWTSASATAGFYGTEYAFANTSPTSRDHVKFWFYLDQPRTLAVDGWWTAGTNRADGAPFAAFDANGVRHGPVRIDQRVNGGQWNEVATWAFTAGWNQIIVAARDDAGAVVIADAVRLREP